METVERAMRGMRLDVGFPRSAEVPSRRCDLDRRST